MSAGLTFKPRILGFVCHWWAYGAADLAGVSRLQYTSEIRLIRVMCSGRVDLEFILRSFRNGVDGVFVGGCRLNECNYITHGNFHALAMVKLARKILEHIGINPDRLQVEFMSSGEGNLFAELVDSFTENVRKIGPLGKDEELELGEIRSRLEQVSKLVPYIKLQKRDKLSARLGGRDEYDDLFTAEEIDELLNKVISYYIDPEKCQACMMCAKRCPVDAIDGGKNLIHIIDQDKCIKCGSCFDACPERFGAVTKISEEPVPSAIADDKRVITRKGKKDSEVQDSA